MFQWQGKNKAFLRDILSFLSKEAEYTFSVYQVYYREDDCLQGADQDEQDGGTALQNVLRQRNYLKYLHKFNLVLIKILHFNCL